jgi:ADP-ribosylglycohydrolase
MPPSEDQFAGCLIGQCVGDAVGFMVEGSSPEVCRRYADAVLLAGQSYEGRRSGFAFGQYSDDSQLARELMQSCVDRGRFDPADYAARIAALFSEGQVVGAGWATTQAAARLAEGTSWEHSGTPPPSAGNGSAMRAAPIGLLFHDDPEALIAAAHDQGRITHADPRCSAGAVAIAGAVAHVLAEPFRGKPIEPAVLLDLLADWAATFDQGFAGALRRLAAIVPLAPDAAVGAIVEVGQPDFRDPPQGIHPFVTTSVLWSLYAFLRSPDDYIRVVHTAVAVGGDVDTTAAMAGAIAGARNGLGAIPAALIDPLNDRGQWRSGDLIGLARRLWRLKGARPRG